MAMKPESHSVSMRLMLMLVKNLRMNDRHVVIVCLCQEEVCSFVGTVI